MARTPVTAGSYIPGLTPENNPRRGGNFNTATAQRQEEALAGLESFGSRIPERVDAEIDAATRKLAGGANPQSKKQAEGVLTRLNHFQESMGTYSTSMAQSVRSVRDAALMPIEAARLQSRTEGRLIVPEAGKFYGTKYEMTHAAAQSHSRDPQHMVSAMLATPVLSALSDPQTELQAGSGLSFIKAHGHHGSVTLSDENVKQINTQLSNKKEFSGDLISHSGTHPLSTLPPAVLAGLATHYRAAQQGRVGATSHWFAGATINAPDSLSDALHDFGNLGAGGWTKGARAVRTFNNPIEEFGKVSTEGAHKIPSYTLNTLKNSDELYRAGVHHYLGSVTHGQAWHEQNPDAAHIIGKAASLPQWKDPTYTGDVHSGKLSSGLPTAAQEGLGDILRPENLFKGMLPRATPHPRSTRTSPILQTPSDMGYFIGEEAHNRASRSSHFVTGASGLQVPAPAEVTQALGWAGKQAQDKGETLKSIRGASDISQIINPNQINQLNPLRTYRA